MNYSAIIDAMGGTTAVARLCGVTGGAVSQWRTNGIPKPWMRFFMERYPNIFTDLKAGS